MPTAPAVLKSRDYLISRVLSLRDRAVLLLSILVRPRRRVDRDERARDRRTNSSLSLINDRPGKNEREIVC